VRNDGVCGDMIAADDEVIALPALVRGRLVEPPELPLDRLRALADTPSDDQPVSVLARPLLDATLAPTGQRRLLIVPRPEPQALVEPDGGAAIRDLLELRFADVLAYVGGLAQQAMRDGADLARALRTLAGAPAEARAVQLMHAQLGALLDPAQIALAVDRELAVGDTPGRAALDDWITLGAATHRGATARIADNVYGPSPLVAGAPAVRAVPTRQLHVTAGNSFLVPFVSALWSYATKAAAVIKAPGDAVLATSLLVSAIGRMDPEHPLTRHLSLVYWAGGDRRTEQALLAGGRFERAVVWGSAATVADLAPRLAAAGDTLRTLVLGPRTGASLIGHDALADLEQTAARAAADSMIADQAACTASLVHLVEGTDAQALDYCEALRAALADWDRAMPLVLSTETVGRLARLRRGAFAQGTWFVNGRWPHVTSTVVLMRAGFDHALHPGGRCVVVRSVPSLREGLRAVRPPVGSVGVAPESDRAQLRDELVVRGADRVLPLGEAERGYPGIPHDGVRVLSQLVRWVSA
jgi:hypothetical protein